MSSSPSATASELSSDKASALGDRPSADATPSVVKDVTPSVVKDAAAAEVTFPGEMPSLDLKDNPPQEEADPSAAVATGPAAAAAKTAQGKIPSLEKPSLEEPPSTAAVNDLAPAEDTSSVNMPPLDPKEKPYQKEPPSTEAVNDLAAADDTSSANMPPLDPKEKLYQKEPPSTEAVNDLAAEEDTSSGNMPPLDPKEKPYQKEPPSTEAVNDLAAALEKKPYQEELPPFASVVKELSEDTAPTEEQAMGKTTLAKKLLSANLPTRIRRPSHILGVPDPKGAILLMVIASLLYSMVAMWLLGLVSDQPAAFVWVTSQLAVFLFTIGKLCMSTTRFSTIFFRISYVEFLSVTATHFIGTISGAAVATILSFYCAGMFGNALAEYLQRNKIKESANVVLASSLAEQEGSISFFILMHGMMSFVVALRMVFLVLHPPSVLFFLAVKDHVKVPLFIVEEFSLEMLFLSLPCCCFMSLILQKETIISASMMLCKIPSWVAVFYILSTIFSVVLGEVASVLILWPVAMAMVGLFGYILAMCGHAKKIPKRASPPTSINKLQG